MSERRASSPRCRSGDGTDLNVCRTYDEYILAGAQAFFQGLYPPLNSTFHSNTTVLNSYDLLASNQSTTAPLGGYQYVQLYSASPLDPNAIFLDGSINCPNWENSAAAYFSTPQYQAELDASNAFYARFANSIFGGELPNNTINYRNAWFLYDYLSYGYVHNSTVRNAISLADLNQAQYLADTWEYALYGNVSATNQGPNNRLQAISGRTVAAEILGSFYNNIQSTGSTAKLSTLFTTFEPMMSLAAIFGLPNISANFTGLPDLGSSMVFELFTTTPQSSPQNFPATQDLQVRFLFRNGTRSNDNLNGYPIFGRGNANMVMSLGDFASAMENIAIDSVADWCTLCASPSVFCPGYTSNSGTGSSPNGITASRLPPAQRPAIAGIIGAIIGMVILLALLGTILAIAMFCFGLRFYRNKTKRRSELGGFKGAEKLASDVDLTVPKAAVGASVVGERVVGQERVGSWELGNASKAKDLEAEGTTLGRPSFEADGASLRGEAVRVEERV